MGREDKFWRNVRKGDGCWEWMGSRTKDGYGRFYLAMGKRVYAHRYSYVLVNGPIPNGLLVRHDCDNPRCVRPDHLRIGTEYDNTMDAYRRGRPYGRRKSVTANVTVSGVRLDRTPRNRVGSCLGS